MRINVELTIGFPGKRAQHWRRELLCNLNLPLNLGLVDCIGRARICM